MPPRREGTMRSEPASANTVDAQIIYWVIILTREIYTNTIFCNLTDCAFDNFRHIVDNWDRKAHMSVEDFRDAVLDWAFASCGRKGYDKIMSMLDSFENQ